MKGSVIVGIALLVGGAIILGYGHFSYTTREKVLEIGPLKATTESTKIVPLPPILGWVLVASGACVLSLGVLPRKG